jgi:hypothetical protein
MVQDIIWRADSHSACHKYSAFFMEHEGSLSCSQKPAIGPFLSQPNPVRPIDTYLPKVHINVIFSLVPRSSQWSLTFGTPNQNPVNTSPLPHACHMSRPPRPPWFNHPNNIQWRIQAVKFIIMEFSPRLLRNVSKCLLRHVTAVGEMRNA